MADSVTTLNPGAGGDSMDESQVTQAGGASAKRPRVVLGDDDGTLTSSAAIMRCLELILREMRIQTVLLQALTTTSANPVSIFEAIGISSEIHNE